MHLMNKWQPETLPFRPKCTCVVIEGREIGTLGKGKVHAY